MEQHWGRIPVSLIWGQSRLPVILLYSGHMINFLPFRDFRELYKSEKCLQALRGQSGWQGQWPAVPAHTHALPHTATLVLHTCTHVVTSARPLRHPVLCGPPCLATPCVLNPRAPLVTSISGHLASLQASRPVGHSLPRALGYTLCLHAGHRSHQRLLHVLPAGKTAAPRPVRTRPANVGTLSRRAQRAGSPGCGKVPGLGLVTRRVGSRLCGAGRTSRSTAGRPGPKAAQTPSVEGQGRPEGDAGQPERLGRAQGAGLGRGRG